MVVGTALVSQAVVQRALEVSEARFSHTRRSPRKRSEENTKRTTMKCRPDLFQRALTLTHGELRTLGPKIAIRVCTLAPAASFGETATITRCRRGFCGRRSRIPRRPSPHTLLRRPFIRHGNAASSSQHRTKKGRQANTPPLALAHRRLCRRRCCYSTSRLAR